MFLLIFNNSVKGKSRLCFRRRKIKTIEIVHYITNTELIGLKGKLSSFYEKKHNTSSVFVKKPLK